MGNENNKNKSKEDINSNISVLDRSLESISPIFDDSSDDSGFEVITDFKERVKPKKETIMKKLMKNINKDKKINLN